jgi:hypothetical protein
MPRLHDDSWPADVWFEAGMIYFYDPQNPETIGTCTVNHFEAWLDNCIKVHLDRDEKNYFVCGRRAVMRFYSDAKEMVKEVRQQLHVGLPIDVISDVERSRVPVSRRQGFDPPGLIATPAGTSLPYSQRASGLIVPVS